MDVFVTKSVLHIHCAFKLFYYLERILLLSSENQFSASLMTLAARRGLTSVKRQSKEESRTRYLGPGKVKPRLLVTEDCWVISAACKAVA